MWYKVRHDMMSACRTWRHAEAPISIEYPDFSKNSKRQSIRKLCLLKSFNGYTVQEKTRIAKWQMKTWLHRRQFINLSIVPEHNGLTAGIS